MGNNLFGVNISNILATNLGATALTITLTKVTPGTRGANPTGGTNPTTSDYIGKGFILDYKLRELQDSIIQTGDRKVILYGDTFTVTPEIGDKVTAEGKQYTIMKIWRGPDAATYECQCRR